MAFYAKKVLAFLSSDSRQMDFTYQHAYQARWESTSHDNALFIVVVFKKWPLTEICNTKGISLLSVNVVDVVPLKLQSQNCSC